MLNNKESLTAAITDAAYEAAYASNMVYDDLKIAEADVEQKSRLANLYEKAEGEMVLGDEVAVLMNRVDVAKRIFDLLCDAAGVVMSPTP